MIPYGKQDVSEEDIKKEIFLINYNFIEQLYKVTILFNSYSYGVAKNQIIR